MPASWTYDPSSMDVALNRVRLLLGDIDESDKQLGNEEIQLFIDITTSDQEAAAQGARALAARYAKKADKWVGDLKILASQKARQYRELAEEIEAGAVNTGIPYAGGIRQSTKDAVEADTDLIVPSFRRNMFDYEGDPS